LESELTWIHSQLALKVPEKLRMENEGQTDGFEYNRIQIEIRQLQRREERIMEQIGYMRHLY
jgi:hypothetical protein